MASRAIRFSVAARPWPSRLADSRASPLELRVLRSLRRQRHVEHRSEGTVNVLGQRLDFWLPLLGEVLVYDADLVVAAVEGPRFVDDLVAHGPRMSLVTWSGVSA